MLKTILGGLGAVLLAAVFGLAWYARANPAWAKQAGLGWLLPRESAVGERDEWRFEIWRDLERLSDARVYFKVRATAKTGRMIVSMVEAKTGLDYKRERESRRGWDAWDLVPLSVDAVELAPGETREWKGELMLKSADRGQGRPVLRVTADVRYPDETKASAAADPDKISAEQIIADVEQEQAEQAAHRDRHKVKLDLWLN